MIIIKKIILSIIITIVLSTCILAIHEKVRRIEFEKRIEELGGEVHDDGSWSITRLGNFIRIYNEFGLD